MSTLRTPEMYRKYEQYKKEGNLSNGCNLCEKAQVIKEFTHWKIVEALFPWDRIAKIQNMIIPKRHIQYPDLNTQEKEEFDSIKVSYIDPEYDLIAEATTKIKSIPEHFHLHLINIKD